MTKQKLKVEPLDPYVFRDGKIIAALDGCVFRLERFIQEVRRRSGQPIDWYFAEGVGVVKYMGDVDKVTAAMDASMRLLNDRIPWRKGECGLCAEHGSHITARMQMTS